MTNEEIMRAVFAGTYKSTAEEQKRYREWEERRHNHWSNRLRSYFFDLYMLGRLSWSTYYRIARTISWLPVNTTLVSYFWRAVDLFRYRHEPLPQKPRGKLIIEVPIGPQPAATSSGCRP